MIRRAIELGLVTIMAKQLLTATTRNLTLVKPVSETAPKSLFWITTCLPVVWVRAMIGLLKMSLFISQSRLKEIRKALPVVLWVRWGNRTRISTLFSLGAVIRKRSLCPWDPCISGASVDPRGTRCAYICEFSINWPVFMLFIALFVTTDTRHLVCPPTHLPEAMAHSGALAPAPSRSPLPITHLLGVCEWELPVRIYYCFADVTSRA